MLLCLFEGHLIVVALLKAVQPAGFPFELFAIQLFFTKKGGCVELDRRPLPMAESVVLGFYTALPRMLVQ